MVRRLRDRSNVGLKVDDVGQYISTTLTIGLVYAGAMEGVSTNAISGVTTTDTSMTYNSTYGKISQGAYLNGTGSYTTLSTNCGFTKGGTTSRSARLKPDSGAISGAQCPILLIDGTTKMGFLLSFQPGSIIHYGIEAGCVGGIPTYSYTTSTSAFTHFVITFSNGTAKLYINGVYVSTGTNSSSGSCSSTNLGILGDGPGYRAKYKGAMDEVYIWSKVLTDGGVSVGSTAGGEIAELYNSGNGVTYPF